MAESIVQPSAGHSCCGSLHGIIRDPICTRDSASEPMIWFKGGELFRCGPCEEAIIAYEKACETWPWARSLSKSNRSKRSLSDGVLKTRMQFMERLSKLVSRL